MTILRQLKMLINLQVVVVVIIIETCNVEFIQAAIMPSAHVEGERQIDTLTKFEIKPWTHDNYYFTYETSSGSQREESGFLKKSIDGNDVLSVKGFYSYVGPDNEIYRVDYTADENGYHATQFNSNMKLTQLENISTMELIPIGLKNRILPPGLIASLTG